MPRIIYDVAVSLDGYIAGPDGDISRFAQEGPVVEDYLDRLQGYGTAIMGRATYEFGYRFGMAPGDNPYPHMQTRVYSSRLDLPGDAAVTQVTGDALTDVAALRAADGDTDIYLCGGGAFAGALLGAGLIDLLRLKRAPVLLGSGTPLFEGRDTPPVLQHVETRDYGDGLTFQEFTVAHAARIG